ncbi:MAG TPA: Ig-like domain-containing protein [Gaiellaceae bacterium]|nr:Ig-like domain-containing protein [Gaiellaceae bacterium]
MSRPRRLLERRSVRFLAAFVLTTAIAGAAFAYFSSIGRGSGTASVGQVAPPTGVVATARNNSTTLGPAPVTVTWNAPASGATPTGYRVVRDDGSMKTTLSCTTSPCSDTTVTDGTYTYHVTSLFGDSWTSSAADSNQIQVQNQQTTSTHLASSDSPSVAGEQVTYTATVSTGSGTPTASVTFKDGTSTITCESGSSSFNGTTATCKVTYSSVTGGSPHAITAVYSGDGNYLGSTSNEVDQIVNQASTTTAVASNHNPAVTGQSVTYTATISVTAPGSGTPTGTVNFKDGGTTITGCGTQTISGGQATCTVAGGYTASGGSHTITAVYSGDTNFNGSTSSNLSQTVNPAATSTALASNNNPSVTGQSVTYTATISVTAPGSGTPTGTVNFKDGGTTITGCGTQTISGGQATCTTSYASAGSHTITAVYSGDTNFNGSTSSNLTQSVNIFAGIDFVKTGPAGGTLSCNYASITAVTCSLTGLGNGGATVTGNIRLINASHNAFTNTGSSISVNYSLSGQASGLTPASPQSIATGSSSTPSLSFTMSNGSNKTATLTGTVTLNGATYTVTLTASS